MSVRIKLAKWLAPELVEERQEFVDCMSSISSFLGVGLGEDHHNAEQFHDRIMWGLGYQADRFSWMLDAKLQAHRTLRSIASQRTPKANAAVNRMADMAEAALKGEG